jgi:AraC-like DNA-binding protein
VLYVGLLGKPSVRAFGCYTIYLSLGKPCRIRLAGGEWEEALLAIVPPYVEHRINSDDRLICSVSIESETVQADQLPACLRHGRGAVEAPELALRMRAALESFVSRQNRQYAGTLDFDTAFFGAALPARALDPRIRAVVERIKNDPNSHVSGEECAGMAHLSVSRFLHLFKMEVGWSFRGFRTWQRARSRLFQVTRNTSLVNIALDMGYPDSTHFSHSIRRVYGLTPKSLFAGSRKLALYGGMAASA